MLTLHTVLLLFIASIYQYCIKNSWYAGIKVSQAAYAPHIQVNNN